jgi:fermentation-respiration switch protein FrsA (DUF1100 family)
MAEPASDPHHSTDRDSAQRRRDVIFVWLLAVAAAAAGLWLTSATSETFYFAWPFTFAAAWVTLHRASFPRYRRKAVFGFVAIASLWLLFHIFDRHSPAESLVPGERSVAVYFLVNVFLLMMALWWLVGACLARFLRPDRGRWRAALLATRAAVLLLVLWPYGVAVLQIHHLKRPNRAHPRQLHLPAQDIAFRTRDGLTLRGWFVPANDSDTTVIVCHGVADNRSGVLPMVHGLQTAGFNVLTFDFRGHGESDGHTSSYGTLEKWDVMAAIDHARAQYPQRSRHVVGVGWSMGAAALVLAAAEDSRIEALHVDAVFARAFDITRNIIRGPPEPLLSYVRYTGTALACLESGTNLFALAPINAVGRIAPRPIMLVHGDADELIPLAQGQAVYEAAGPPKSFHVVRGAGHCQTLDRETPEYERRMVAFLREAVSGAPESQPTR